jgi:hypothetical protein
MLSVQLSRRRIIASTIALAVVNVVLLWGTYLVRVFWRDDHWWPALYLGRQFDLARENNPAVWYASMVLFAVALAMLACFAIDRRRSSTPRERTLTYGWLIGAAMFALLSLDEAGSLHERINSLEATVGLPGAIRIDSPGWVGVLAIPIGLAGALLLAFAWFRVRRNPVAFVLMSTGTLLFLSIPVQEHIEVARWLVQEPGGGARRSVAVLLEEGTELFGALCFLIAAGWYACGQTMTRDADAAATCRIELPGARTTVLPAVVLLAGGLLMVELVLPELLYVDQGSGRGIPQNWFPAVLALLVAAASMLLAKRHRQAGRRGTAAAFLLFALVHLALSIDHGSGQEFTHDLFSAFPRRRLILDLLWITTLAMAAFALGRTASFAAIGLVASLWLALAIVPFWVGGSLRPAFGFVAYALVLPLLIASGAEPFKNPYDRKPSAPRVRADAHTPLVR